MARVVAPLQRGLPAMVERMRSRAFAMPSVSALEVNSPPKGAGAAGLRHLLRDDLPSVKYHNPETPVAITRDAAPGPSVTVMLADGASVVVDAAAKTQEQILIELLEAGGAEEAAVQGVREEVEAQWQ